MFYERLSMQMWAARELLDRNKSDEIRKRVDPIDKLISDANTARMKSPDEFEVFDKKIEALKKRRSDEYAKVHKKYQAKEKGLLRRVAGPLAKYT